jgi:hypothetical protein
MLLIIGVLAGAIAGGLVEYLLGLWLPEKPTIRHIAAILVFALILISISIWVSPEDEQASEVVAALTGIQTREVELATAFANFSNTDLSENSGFISTSEAYATQFADLELTRLFLEIVQPTFTARPSKTPTALPTNTRTPRPTNSSTPRPATVQSSAHTPEPPIQAAINQPVTSTITPLASNNNCPDAPPELSFGTQRQVLGCELPCTAIYHTIFTLPTFPYSVPVADVAYPAVVQVMGGPVCVEGNGDAIMIFIKVQAVPGPGLFYSPQGELYDQVATGYISVGGFQTSDPEGTMYWQALTR